MNLVLVLVLLLPAPGQLCPFLFQLFFLFRTFITANMNVNLIGHNTIIAKLNGFMKPKTVSDVLGFL